MKEVTTALKRSRFAIACFYFMQGLVFASWASRIPNIKTALGVPDNHWGSILFAIPIGQFVTMQISGYCVDRFSSKKVMPIAAIAYGIGLIVLGFANSAWILTACLFFFGVFANFCNISINTQGVNIEKLYPHPIMASFHGAWSLAGFSGSAIAMLMLKLKLTPLEHFVIIAILTTLNCLINTKYLLADEVQLKKEKTIKAKLTFKEKINATITKLIPNKTILQLGIIAFFAMACEGAMFDWSGVYFEKIVHAPAKLILLGYSSFMLMMATGRFIGDRLVMRFGRKRLMQCNGILIFIGLMIAISFPTIIAAAIGFALVGLGVSTNVPNVYSVGGELKDMSPTVAIASISGISFLGFLIGPPMIGYISGALGLKYAYGVICLFGLTISFIVTKLKVLK